MTAFSRRCYQIKSAEGDLIYGLLQGGQTRLEPLADMYSIAPHD